MEDGLDHLWFSMGSLGGEMDPGRGDLVASSPLNFASAKKHIILIPGFLSEKEEIGFGCHDISEIAHLENCDWFRHFLQRDEYLDANVYYFNWPSLNIRKGLYSIGKNIFPRAGLLSQLPIVGAISPLLAPLITPVMAGLVLKAREPWCEAVSAADKAVHSLVGFIKGLEGQVFLIGHSLGGRIALRVLQHQEKIKVEKLFVCSLAPAIAEAAYRMSYCHDHVKNEVFYSKYDGILKFLFRLGQSSFSPALGLSGPDYNKYRNALKGIDVSSTSFCEKMGHSSYEGNLTRLISIHSRMWKEFKFN